MSPTYDGMIKEIELFKSANLQICTERDQLRKEVRDLREQVRVMREALDRAGRECMYAIEGEQTYKRAVLWADDAIKKAIRKLNQEDAAREEGKKMTEDTSDIEKPICRACNGSGEGYYTTNDKCLACGGSGVEIIVPAG